MWKYCTSISKFYFSILSFYHPHVSFLFFFPLFFSSTPFPYLYLLWHSVWRSRSTFLLFFSSLATLRLELSLTHKDHPSSLCIFFFFDSSKATRKREDNDDDDDEDEDGLILSWFCFGLILSWVWDGFSNGVWVDFKLFFVFILSYFWVAVVMMNCAE